MNKLFDLSGKTALIIGASGGLGEQFTKTLFAAGARVNIFGSESPLLFFCGI